MSAGRVIVTGGSGFIGSYITRTLWEHGFEVGVIDIVEPSTAARFVLGDALEATRFFIGPIDDARGVLEAARKFLPRSFIHVAAVVDPEALMTDPMLALRVNLGGTINVLEAARQVDSEGVVLLSSIGVLPAIQYEPVDGAHPVILPTEGPSGGFYGASKVASESFCFAYQQSYGLDIRIVRPSAVYGFGMQWPLYLKPIVENAVRGEKVVLDDGGSFPRDYTHAQDVASLAVRLVDAPESADRVFYAGTGRPLVTPIDIATAVRTLIPEAEIAIEPTLTDLDETYLKYRGVLSVENARTQLGWEPEFGDIRAGIREYVGRYRAYVAAQKHTTPDGAEQRR